MPSSGVRPARVADAGRIAEIQLAAWAADALLPSEIIVGLAADDLEADWVSALLNPPTATHLVLIAHEDEVLHGYAVIGPATTSDAAIIDGTGELLDLVVFPASRGAGHGSRLMSAAADATRESGYLTWITWCPLTDEPRRAFYASAGWGPDGSYRDLALSEDRVLRQVRMVTDLSEDTAQGSDEPPR